MVFLSYRKTLCEYRNFTCLQGGPIVAGLQEAFGLQLLAQYFIHYLPSEPRLMDVLLVSVIGLTLTVLASLYPARRAARLVPTEILRHE